MKTKKELKEAYKQQKPQMGIFQIQNKKNGKVLLEASSNIPSRWNRHRMELRFGNHRNLQLQADWNEHGEENFVFSIVSKLEIQEGETVDVTKELALLMEMVEEEMALPAEVLY